EGDEDVHLSFVEAGRSPSASRIPTRRCSRGSAKATRWQTFPIYENIAKIPIQEDGGDRRSDDQR
ncbi:MAG: hypothetical protein ACREXY_08815, partial [Gammaproteobacteria bacterium]